MLLKIHSYLLEKKVNKDITPNNEQVIEFLEKYDGENLVIFEIYSNKLDERKKLTKSLKKSSKLFKSRPNVRRRN